MKASTAIVAMVFLTLAAGAGGGYLGVHYGLQQTGNPTSLDALMHHRLDLSTAQRARIAALEGKFAAERRPLEADLARARRALVSAISAEHRYGPQVAQAVTYVHQAMGALQQATLQHVLAMRAVLTPEQARQFDATVAEALSSDSP
jgi:Spy/CpxP family protein refolding chaperone